MNNQKIKILAVDDKQSNLIALQSIFMGTNYDVLEASSGMEAIKILEKNPDIAVILLDVQMPEMDGYQTAMRIKELESIKDIPIIFITAVYREDPFVRKGYEVGAIDYFSKPFDPEILKLKVGVYSASKQKTMLLKEREKRIAETEEVLKVGKKLSATLEKLPLGVLITNSHGEICQINEEISRIVGIDKLFTDDNYGEILKWWSDIHSLLKIPGSPLDMALYKGESSHNEVVRIKCLNNSTKTVYISASPLRGLDGHIVGAGIFIQDITESKKIEKEMEIRVLNLLKNEIQLEEITKAKH